MHETISGKASAQYRACGQSFGAFLSFRWQLFRGETELALGNIRSNTSSLTLPPFFFTPDEYTTKLTVSGYHNDSEVWTSTFRVNAPLPVVRLGGLSNFLRTGPLNINIRASITVAYGNITTNGTWACSNVTTAEGGECPTSITNALTSATNNGVTIAGPVEPGRYLLNLTYNGQSSTLEVEVVAAAVPSVSITPLSTALAEPQKYAYNPRRTLTFRGRAESADPVTGYVWSLNGVQLAFIAQVIDLNMTQLVAGAVNNLTLRVNTAASYGQTTIPITVAAVPTLTLSAMDNVDKFGAAYGVALTDRIRVNVTASATSIFGIPLTYSVSFDDVRLGRLQRPRTAPPQLSSGSLIFQAPMPTTSSDEVTVTFFVDLLLEGQLMVTASSTFLVRTVARAEAAAAQAAQLAVTTDVNEVLSIISTMGSIMENATLRNQFASQAVEALKSQGELTPEQSAQAVNSLSTMVTPATAGSVVDVLLKMNVPAENAATALDVVQSVLTNGGRSDQAVAATEKIANAVLESTPIGESKTVSSGSVSIVTSRVLLTNDNVTVSGASSSVTLPAGGIPGLREGDVGGIVGSEFTNDPFGSNTTTSTPVVAFTVMVNGTVLNVTNLNPPMIVEISSSDPAKTLCSYFDVPLKVWSFEGVTKVGYSTTKVRCATTHLTAFAGLQATSSAASVVASMTLAFVAVILQLLMNW